MKNNFRSNIIKNIFLIILLITLAACTFNEPVLPKWFTFWEIPFPETTFEMSDAIDNEYIFADTTDQGIPILNISIKDSLTKEGISAEDLSIKPDPDTLSKSIIDISVSSPGSEATNPTTIQDLLPFPIQVGNTINIPDISVTLPSQSLEFSSFQYSMTKTGKVSLVFNNNTFLSIKPGMQVGVFDDSTSNLAGIPFGEQIGTATFPAIGPFSSVPANDSLDLMDKLISHKLRLGEMQVPLQPDTHLVRNTDTSGYVQNELTISDLTISEAKAEIPRQTISQTGAKSIEDRENRVRSAKTKHGQVFINIENQLRVEATVLITLPNFKDQNSATFTRSKIIPKQSMIRDSLQLDDLEMFNHIHPNALIDSVHYNVDIETTPSTGKIYISDKDSVIVSFLSDYIFFSEFDGIIDTVEVPIDTVKKEKIFDYKDFNGDVSFEDLKMDLTLFNELGIAIDINIDIMGEKRNPDTGMLEKPPVSLNGIPNPITLTKGSVGNPSINTITLNSSNSNIIEFIKILPTDIVMSGNATIMGEGSVTINDSIWGEYKIHSPMNILVDSIPTYEAEIDSLLDLNEDMKNALKERFQEAGIQLEIVNGLPIATELILAFATDTADFFIADSSNSSKLIIDNIKLPAAPIGSDGYASSPVQNQININLDQDQLKIFSNDTLLMGSKIIFPETNKRMKFRSTDALNIDGTLRFKVIMKEE